MKIKFLINIICFVLIVNSFGLAESNQSSDIDQQGISGDIFGRNGGYFHPFLSIAQNYSDNIFLENTNCKDDFYSEVSPGFLINIPGSVGVMPGLVQTSTTSPGGLKLSRITKINPRKFYLNFLYLPLLKFYSKYTDENVENHNVQGFFQYNFNGGLTIDSTTFFT